MVEADPASPGPPRTMSNAKPLPKDDTSSDEQAEAPAPAPAKANDEPGIVERTMTSLGDEDWSPRGWRDFFRDTYFTFDRRTLGFTCFFLGFLLMMDLVHRG